jgi:hypothetical protein
VSTHPHAQVLAPGWYAELLGEGFAGAEALIERAFPAWLGGLARRVPAIRGLLLFRLAGDHRGSAVILGQPGAATLLFCEAWLRRRRGVVVLELIPRRPDRRLRRALHRAWAATVLEPAMRRAMAAGQVLSEGERRTYARKLRIAPERLVTIPWAWSSWPGQADPPAADGREGVLASGRAWSDWETLFAAARGSDWPLTVVHGERYRDEVPRLNRDRRARVLCEIPAHEHAQLLRRAAVYVMPLRADAPSAGQVRLMAATDAGAPVIATRVATLEGYVEDGVNAVLVPPGDPERLATAIERLLASPSERQRLAEAARERARRRTYVEYFEEIGALLRESLLRGD